MMKWHVEILNQAVMEELEDLPTDMRAKLDRIVHLIEELGLHNVQEPYVKPLQDKLWEMRVKGTRRHSQSHIRHLEGPAGRHFTCVPQEDPKDPSGCH